MERQDPSPGVNVSRILVRGVNWLGDAVMSTPALMRLREKFPEAHLTILASEKLRDLWLHHPAIDEIISFAPKETIFTVANKLRSGKFDTALVLPNSPRSAIEVFLAGIPKRIGYARPWRNFFLTEAIAPRTDAVKMRKRSVPEIQKLVSGTSRPDPAPPETSHQIHEYLNLTAALGANSGPLQPHLAVTTEEVEAARRKFGLEKIANPVLGLNAGAEYGPAKRWPLERFISAAGEIQQRTHCAWILFGGKNDVEMAGQIGSALHASNSTCFNLAGKTSLRELMSLLRLCRMLLTNDSGPMHLAAALGVPVVAIFGSTSPELTGPMSNDARILKSDAPCSPCFLRECPIDFRCMNGVKVERVVEEVCQVVR